MRNDPFESPAKLYQQQNRFAHNEVGLTHPELPSFIRLCDNGNVEIVAGDEVAIILNPNSRTIMFNADSIKFFTRTGGLRWNKVAFNERAVGFSEPTFITIEDEVDIKSIYRGADYFIDDPITAGKMTIRDPDSGQNITIEEYANKFVPSNTQQAPTSSKTNPNNLREI